MLTPEQGVGVFVSTRAIAILAPSVRRVPRRACACTSRAVYVSIIRAFFGAISTSQTCGPAGPWTAHTSVSLFCSTYHREHDAAAEHQTRETRGRAAPERQNTLVAQHLAHAVQRSVVVLARLERLHTRLDDTVLVSLDILERHGCVWR